MISFTATCQIISTNLNPGAFITSSTDDNRFETNETL